MYKMIIVRGVKTILKYNDKGQVVSCSVRFIK